MRIVARTPAAHGRGGWGLTQTPNGGKLRGGSGVAILEAHMQLLAHLDSSGARRKYRWFVMARPDLYYLCELPRVGTWSPDAITVPSATNRRFDGGREVSREYVHDEFALVPRAHVGTYLTTMQTALRETARRGRLWCGERHNDEVYSPDADYYCATERMLGGHLERNGIQVVTTPLPVLLVRGLDGPGWPDMRPDELPTRVQQDLKCLHVALASQYEPALDACTRAQGHSATLRHLLLHSRGAELGCATVLAGIVTLYVVSALCMCVRRG